MSEYNLYRNSAQISTKTEMFWIDLCPHTEEKNKHLNTVAMYYTHSLGEGPHTSRKIFPHVDKFVWW